MSGTKDQLMDYQWVHTMSSILGISEEDLSDIVFEVKPDLNSDGEVTQYKIEFDLDRSNSDVLGMIQGLENGNNIVVQSHHVDVCYEYRINAALGNNDHYSFFQKKLNDLKQLLAIKITRTRLVEIHKRQIFISVIGAMETYLSATLLNKVLTNDLVLQKFVSSHPEFRKRKFELREIFEKYIELKDISARIIVDTIFHNLPVVKKMYEDSLNIKFPNISKCQLHVNYRHDLVHRNGQTKDGKKIIITEGFIKNVLLDVTELVDDLNSKLNKNFFDFDDSVPF